MGTQQLILGSPSIVTSLKFLNSNPVRRSLTLEGFSPEPTGLQLNCAVLSSLQLPPARRTEQAQGPILSAWHLGYRNLRIRAFGFRDLGFQGLRHGIQGVGFRGVGELGVETRVTVHCTASPGLTATAEP